MTDFSLLQKLYPDQADKLVRQLHPTPEYVRPIITLSDKDSKFITRYFIRHMSDTTMITEIDKNQYAKFKDNSRYVTTEVRWKIVGKKETIKQPNNIEILGTVDSNKIAVSKADLTFGGLMNYITNYSEFWLGES